MKRIISVLLAVLLIVSIIPFSAISAAAQSDNTAMFTRIGGSGRSAYSYRLARKSSVSSESGDNSVQEVLPEKFDSRDYSYLTSVKDQDIYSNCWSFAQMACAETSAIKNCSFSSADFSEFHNSYFTYNESNDSLKLTKGDKSMIIDGSEYADIGGNDYVGVLNLASWQGPVIQSICSQPINGDALTIPSISLAYDYDQLHLRDACWVYMSDPSLIKSLLLKYGIASVGYYADTEIDDNIAAYNYSGDENANHEVALVGWDDNYSKYNFPMGHRPEKDGAWIIKNSWGTDLGDKGYYYISYEDTGISKDYATFYKYEKASADKNKTLYQYDGSHNPSEISCKGKTAYESNIFNCVQPNSYLEDVSFYTDSDAEKYEVYIYLNPTAEKPMSGTLAAKLTGTQAYSGYHTVSLTSPVAVKNGSAYSVVIKHTSTDGENAALIIDESYRDTTINYVSVSQKGQSYLSDDGKTWCDINYQGGFSNANCRIKATMEKHNFSVSETVPPSCTESGKTVYKCADCGFSYSVTVAPLGHSWGTPVLSVKDGKGLKTFTCSRCKIQKEETYSLSKPASPSFTIKTGEKKCTLSWKAVQNNEYYRVYYYAKSTKKLVLLANVKDCSYTRSGLANNSSYQFLVTAYNYSGESSKSTKYLKTVQTLPARPAVKAVGGAKCVTLSWGKVAGATKYTVYKYASSRYYTVGTTKSTSYTISKLSNATTYTYLVRATSSAGASAYSAANHAKAKTAVSIVNNKVTVRNGSTYQLSVSGGSGSVRWKTSNSKIATVNSSGKVTSKGVGKCYIYATRNGLTARCDFTVTYRYYGTFACPDFGSVIGVSLSERRYIGEYYLGTFELVDAPYDYYIEDSYMYIYKKSSVTAKNKSWLSKYTSYLKSHSWSLELSGIDDYGDYSETYYCNPHNLFVDVSYDTTYVYVIVGNAALYDD